jgi:hypothetical protein
MKNSLLKDAKDSVKLGVVSMAGLNVTGQLSKLTPGSSGLQSNIASGLELANLGQTTKVGLNLTKMLVVKRSNLK